MPKTPRPGALCKLMLLALVLGVGCERSQRHLFTDTVDCTDLPLLPSEFVDAPSVSETLLEDMGGGTARLVLRWEDTDSEDWFLTAETTGFVTWWETEQRWAVQVDLPCIPDAATAVHFASGDVTGDALEAGDYKITAFGFDVPWLEQGDDFVNNEVDGTLTVTGSSSGSASGFMSGRGQADLMSFVTQQSLGIQVEVTALAFRELSLE